VSEIQERGVDSPKQVVLVSSNLEGLDDLADTVCRANKHAILKYPMQLSLGILDFGKDSWVA